MIGTGIIIESPATDSIEPFNIKAGLSLTGSIRGCANFAMIRMKRLAMLIRWVLICSLTSLRANQPGKDSGWPTHKPKAINLRKPLQCRPSLFHRRFGSCRCLKIFHGELWTPREFRSTHD